MSDEQFIDRLARVVWGKDPDPDLRHRAHGFPNGHLLGRARVGAALPAEVLERRRQVAAGLTETDVDVTVAAMQDAVGDRWQVYWELNGFIAPADAPGLEAVLGIDEEDPEDPLAVKLVPAGTTRPNEAVEGLVAPPSVAGLVLRSEGYRLDTSGRPDGQTRIYVAVAADGRWWLRTFNRPGGAVAMLPAAAPDEKASGTQVEIGGQYVTALARLLGLAVSDEDQRFQLAGVRVARNDPCPCGSGRKFKRCHGTTLA